MARLRDLKVGMKVQIVKGKEDPEEFRLTLDECNVGSVGIVKRIVADDPVCQVKVSVPGGCSEWYYPSSWIKIIKDKGENAMKQTKTTKITAPQEYILIDDADISEVFTDVTDQGIFDMADKTWDWDKLDAINRLSSGKMKLFKIEEVKLEVTEPSIKIIG